MKKSVCAVLLCACLLLAACGDGPLIEEIPTPKPTKTPRILVLGDSISTGYGLEGYQVGKVPPNSYAALLSAAKGYPLTDKAVDGRTTITLLAQLNSGGLDADLAAATVVCLTIGGNDMMGALARAVAEKVNLPHAEGATIEDVFNQLDLTTILSLLTVLNSITDNPIFAQALSQATENLVACVDYIRGQNPAAKIILATQYNPYQWIEPLRFGPLSYDLNPPFIKGVDLLNAMLTDPANGAGTKYHIADACTAFRDSTETLTNPTKTGEGLVGYDLDFHPNAAGHQTLADVFLPLVP